MYVTRARRTWHVGRDGTTLQEAVAKAAAKDTILLPIGRLVLDDPLVVDKSLTIRGAGWKQTRLFFPGVKHGR